MICPKCGNKMILGEVASARGDTSLYWLPDSFIDKHWLNTYSHMKKTVLQEGGLIIKANSRIGEVSPSYACKECKLILIDVK